VLVHKARAPFGTCQAGEVNGPWAAPSVTVRRPGSRFISLLNPKPEMVVILAGINDFYSDERNANTRLWPFLIFEARHLLAKGKEVPGAIMWA
jgi:hypothetical protein